MTMFWKNEFWPIDPIPRVGGGGGEGEGLRQNLPKNWQGLYIFATMLLNSWFPLIWYAKWLCSEKMNLTFWPNPLRVAGARGRVCRKIANMVLHFVIPFNLICNMTMSEKVEFWPIDPNPNGPWGEGSVGKIFATMLLHFVIPFTLVCNMTMSRKSWIFDLLIPSPGLGGGGGRGSMGKILATMLLHSWFSFNLICNTCPCS